MRTRTNACFVIHIRTNELTYVIRYTYVVRRTLDTKASKHTFNVIIETTPNDPVVPKPQPYYGVTTALRESSYDSYTLLC